MSMLWRPASAGCHASRPAGLAGTDGKDVPAEVSELLVDTLESHGECVWWCAVVCGMRFAGAGCGRERVVLKS